MEAAEGTVIALDVGERRIGVATAHSVARIAHPLKTVNHTASIFDDITQLVAQEQAVAIVVGLPRGLQGQATAQTAYVQGFVAALRQKLTIPVYFQDEALTSQKAEEELAARGKPYAKGDIDSLAATYILDDFLLEHSGVKI